MVRTVLAERQTSDCILVSVEFSCIPDPSLVEKQNDVFVKVMQDKTACFDFLFFYFIFTTPVIRIGPQSIKGD